MPLETPTFGFMTIEDLRFDPQNPRFPMSLDSSQTAEVLRFMLQDAGLIDLMRSIAKQGFFPGEPLLVSPDTSEPSSWIVVEGNRRLAACLLLSDPSEAPIKKKIVAEVANSAESSSIERIPCLQFSSRTAILSHLGYRHVTGIKEWDPLAKARFLDQQMAGENGSNSDKFRNVARSIGSRSDYVGRLLTAYRLYLKLERRNFFDIHELSDISINFSLIPSALAYANIVNYLGLASSQDIDMPALDLRKWEFVCRVIFERDDRGKTRLGESRNIGTLSNVLANERARDAMEGGATLTQAAQLLGGRSDIFRTLISNAEQNLELAGGEMDGVRFGGHDVEILDRIAASSEALRNMVLERIGGDE